MYLSYREEDGRIGITTVVLASKCIGSSQDIDNPMVIVMREGDRYSATWSSATGSYEKAAPLEVELDHFLPFFRIDRRNIGPRHRSRSWFNGYLVLYEQPLEDLRALLQGFTYLGSMRMLPPSIYRAASVPPSEIGVSGEFAAQMLHARRADVVHYLPPLRIASDGRVIVPDTVEARPLVEAVNQVMNDLGISTEERSIYYAALDKEPPAEEPAGETEFVHDPDAPA